MNANDADGHDHASHAGHSHGAEDGGGHAGHNHAPTDFGRAFLVGTTLNITFVVIEVGFGFYANSMALLADAGHNLSDVAGLLIAWGAATLSKRKPSEHYTYGLRRSSILAALFNALFLLAAMGAITYEAIRRFADPAPVEGGIVMIVAAIGIVINSVTAWMFASGRKGDINIRGAYLHMAADAAVSAGVVVAGFAITLSGFLWIDPVVSLLIVAIIVVGTWGLLRDSVALSLDKVPAGIAPEEVRVALRKQPGVTVVHDLHIWPLSTTEVALTCHLVIPSGHPGDAFLHGAARMLRDQFQIVHSTIQIEVDEKDACLQAPAEAL